LASVFALASPPSLLADEPPTYEPPSGHVLPGTGALRECPEVPEAFEDSAEVEYSQELKELRDQRIETAKLCQAVSDRLDVANVRQAWLVLEAAAGREQRSLTNSQLAEMVESSCGVPCPVQVASDEPGEATGGELVSSVDAGAEASQVALYILIGLLVALPVGALIWRTVDRGL
jgi:hypothetical protein